MTAHLANLQLRLAATAVSLSLSLTTGCDLGAVDGFDELQADYPACSSRATDPDGDGWGWEPAHSCRAPGSGVDDPAYPLCEVGAVDPDGDGWGWQEARSCRVAADDGGGGGGGGEPGACGYVDGWCAGSGSDCRIYDDDGSRAGIKAEIWNAMVELRGGGADAHCRADLAVAVAMQEAHSFAVDGNGNLPYDWTKDDRTDGSQNVCLFNMNIDFIKRSCRTDCERFQTFWDQNTKKYLNRRESLGECVRRLDEGFDSFGIDGALHFHRGGSRGWQHPGSDERAYARAQRVVSDHLRDHPAYRTNGARVAYSIGHR